MLSDRTYMRDPMGTRHLAPLLWLGGTLIVLFLAQSISAVWLKTDLLTEWLGLNPAALFGGAVWQILTYAFVHNPGNILHLLFNLLGLYFLGRELLSEIGTRRFFSAYMLLALTGALAWLCVNYARPTSLLLGASGAIFGLLAIFACRNPNREISILLFLIIPIKVLPKYLVTVLAAIDLIGLLISELPRDGIFKTNIAHSAHLGGLIGGVLFHLWIQRTEVAHVLPASTPTVELPKWLARKKTNVPTHQAVNLTDRAALKVEVDRILDKINISGFASLTPHEKRILDDARDLLSKR